ncbi:MAG: DUF393 domain-containing protein [Bdellovibrionales bacterium]
MKNPELTIYYDGLCPLCSREIDHYRVKDTQGKIEYVDIADPQFDAQAVGLDPQKIHSVFHVKSKDGQVLTKVDAFVAIWDTLEIFSPLSRLAKNGVSRPLFDFGYSVFAKVRPWLPKKDCADGRCEI